MLYIPKIDDLKIVTGEEVKDFVAINFSEYFKSITEERNLHKVVLLYISLTTPDEVEKYVQSSSSDNGVHHYNVEILNLFDPELQLNNTKPLIKNKLKELLSELKKFKVETILVLDHKKNDRKIFCSSTKLITSDSDINEAFKTMHQIPVKKINYACQDWIALNVIIKHSIKIFECL